METFSYHTDYILLAFLPEGKEIWREESDLDSLLPHQSPADSDSIGMFEINPIAVLFFSFPLFVISHPV